MERIELSEPFPNLIIELPAVQEYTFGFGENLTSVDDFSRVLAALTYISNLTVDSLSDPPRNITIVAYDDVGASAPAVINIELRETNRERPVFVFPPGETSYAASIPENSGAGTTVTQSVSASDPDGLAVIYSIAETNGVFDINPFTGVVTVLNSSALDFELTSEFAITIVASDTDPITSFSSQAQLIITLTDENDSPPVFSAEEYEFQVVEELTSALVGRVTADDPDTVGIREYEFVDSTTGLTFLINDETGDIIVRTRLDFESVQQFEFEVQVRGLHVKLSSNKNTPISRAPRVA